MGLRIKIISAQPLFYISSAISFRVHCLSGFGRKASRAMSICKGAGFWSGTYQLTQLRTNFKTISDGVFNKKHGFFGYLLRMIY